MRMVYLLTGLLLSGVVRFPLSVAGDAIPTPPVDSWTVITCDGNLSMDYEANQAFFYNNVVVKNPRGTLQADRLVVFFSPDGKKVEKSEASGHVTVRFGEKSGSSNRMVYYPVQKKAILLGDAVVAAGPNSVRGEKITFYLDREEMEVEGAPDGSILPDRDYDVTF